VTVRPEDVLGWVDAYERVWRTAGTDGVTELFTEDATYLVSPWAAPVVGHPALRELWDAERAGPDEVFTMTREVVAVDGDVAVVRAEVAYERSGTRWRDLWVLRFASDGRCSAFEEWPFSPGQPDGH
jgi:ketosteroid isomerase-like protein